MACATFVQNAQTSDRHRERDPRCPPDWLGPRVSFSKDFVRPGVAHAPISREIMKEIIVEHDSPARSSGKESPSEFEFSMSIQGQDTSYGSTMLPADELFYDGKLLPLYTPQAVSQSDLASGARGKAIGAEFVHANGSIDQANENSISKGPQTDSQRVDSSPISSPKAPSCASRWKELFGLKKMQIQEGKDAANCNRKPKASSQGRQFPTSDPLLAPGRSSDAGNDPKPSSLQDQAFAFPCECFSTADPGLSATTHLQNWPMDRAMSGSRSSKSSDDSEGMETRPKVQKSEVVKHRNSTSSRARSPGKSNSELRTASAAAMSPRRGARGVSPGRPSVGSRPTESSRNAIAARLVVRGLDRSYSSPKPLRKRTDQARSGRQRADGSRSLERSTSYSSSVRVSPVINVPVYISPGLRKGSKNGIFSLSHIFSSKKASRLANNNSNSSSAAHHHHHNNG